MITDTSPLLPVPSQHEAQNYYKHRNIKILWSVNIFMFTVWQTQLGPPNLFLPIARHAQNKRIGVRSFLTNHKLGSNLTGNWRERGNVKVDCDAWSRYIYGEILFIFITEDEKIYIFIPGVMKTGSANLNFLCNFSQLPQCLILACLLLVY